MLPAFWYGRRKEARREPIKFHPIGEYRGVHEEEEKHTHLFHSLETPQQTTDHRPTIVAVFRINRMK
jgi:hypothetical protein